MLRVHRRDLDGNQYGSHCRKGERLRMEFPHGHRKTTTLVAGLRSTGMVVPLVIDGPINGEWFEAYVAQVLVPILKPGDVLILDDLWSHKRPAAREVIEKGARDNDVSSAVQPILQPHGEGLLQAEGTPAEDRRKNCHRAMGQDWKDHRSGRAARGDQEGQRGDSCRRLAPGAGMSPPMWFARSGRPASARTSHWTSVAFSGRHGSLYARFRCAGRLAFLRNILTVLRNDAS